MQNQRIEKQNLMKDRPLFYKKEFDMICLRLIPELERLKVHPERYKKLVDFLVVGEDHRFFLHPGFEVVGIFKGKREGASTIEQQLVRVLTEDYRYSFRRKIKEIYLATKLKKFADKYTLAAAYLDMANYGTDYVGLSSMLKKFDVTLQQDIDKSICAEVVARLKYPEPRRYNAVRMAQIEMRKNHILRLYKEKYERR